MKVSRRSILGGAGALALTRKADAAFAPFMASTSISGPTSVAWQPLSIGAGGLVIGNDIANDGTRICWGDVFGLYLWNGTKWVQLFTSSRIGSGDWLKIWDAAAFVYGGGCGGGGICAGNSQLLYCYACVNPTQKDRKRV